MDTNAVRSTLEHHQNALRNDYGVASLAIFGSTARGEAGATSDIDMLVEFNQPVGYLGLVGLQEYLAAILGRDVDLGTLHGLKPRVREQVEQEMERVL